MGQQKYRTKGAKKRNKRGRTVNDLYAEFESEAVVTSREPEDPPLEAPMRARSISLGVEPTPEVLDAYLETEAGKALFVGVQKKDERHDLFETFNKYDKDHTLYNSRCIGQRMFPAVSKMEFMPERLEATASDVVDIRTPDEKAESTKRKMREWDALFRDLHSWQANIIRSVSFRQETLVHYGELTTAGRSFLAALRALHALRQEG